MLSNALNYASTNFHSFQDDLIACLKIPSISTLTENQRHITDCATHIISHLTHIGLKNIQSFNDYGNPIIYADYFVDSKLPTLLFYGHYDVQPVDPLDLWVSDPFCPEIRDGYIFARGASDNKGMFYTHLKAVQSYLKTANSLPVNVKFVIEGEEEIGSNCMIPFINQYKDLLSNDAVIVSDNPMFSKDQPSICTSTRGLIYFEVNIQSMKYDVHSGQLGGSVPNIIHYVSDMIASLKDSITNRVNIPGFYDDVIKFSSFDASADFATEHIHSLDKYYRLGSHANQSFFDNIWYQPTLDCNGISSGFTAEGAKTVIPNSLMVKLSCRLVSNQNPHKLSDLVSNYIRNFFPKDFDVSINTFDTFAKPLLTDPNSKYVKLAIQALKDTYNKDVVIQGEGGSIPVLAEFQSIFHTPVVLIGLNSPNDNIHAPNERFSIDHFKNGIYSFIRFLNYLSE